MRLRESRTLVACVLLLALTLVVLDTRGTGPGRWLRGAFATVAGPAQRVVSGAVGPLRGTGARGSGASAAELMAANAALRAQLGLAAQGQIDREAARELAAMAPPAGYRQVPAGVIAVAPALELSSAVTVDVGVAQGVTPGAAVISADGLVGVVASVGPRSATVRLVTDRASTVGARVARGGEVGLLRGGGGQESGELELLDPLGAMRAGDLIVTLGSADGQPFPKGVPIGRITEVRGTAAALTRRGLVRAVVDASTLDRVLVLVREDPQP